MIVVADAGPILHLHWIGCLSWGLPATNVHVVEQVWLEIAQHAPEALGDPRLQRHSGTEADPELQRKFSLQLGETAAIRFALRQSSALLLTDDEAARRACATLRLAAVGTIDALRKALNHVSAALDARQFEKASSLGYGKVAEEFVFLQRTLGGLQGACLHKEKLVSDLAFALRCPYEDILPKVDALLESARPLDRKQRFANRKKAPQIRAAIEALTQRYDNEPETARARRREERT